MQHAGLLMSYLCCGRYLSSPSQALFAHIVEVLEQGKWRVYKQAESAVNSTLTGQQLDVQLRSWRSGKMQVRLETGQQAACEA